MARPRKPNELKILQGNPGKRAIPKTKIKFASEKVAPTMELAGYALEYWRYIKPILEASGVLTEADSTELTLLCQTWGKYREAFEQLHGEPLVVLSEKGTTYQNPLVGVCNAYRDAVQKILIQFGMTPAARSAVSAKPDESDNPLAEFL